MKRLAYIFFFVLSIPAFAQEGEFALKHKDACETSIYCRLNIIPMVTTDMQASCKAVLFDELNCDLSLSRIKEEAQVKVVCLDKNQSAIMDQIVPSESLSYLVATVTEIEGQESLKIDPKSYTIFDHPALKILLSEENDKMEGSLTLVLNDGPADFTQVTCSRVNSESGPSSGVQPQSANRF